MTRIRTVSLVFAVLLGPGLCRGIEQTQSTDLNVGDHILLNQGLQAADVLQNLAIANDQVIDGACGEGLLVSIGGAGNASSEGAQIGVLRSLDLSAWQGQIVTGPCTLIREDHTFGLQGVVSVGMSDGAGQSNALQQLVARSDQGAGNFNGTMGATSSVLGLQNTLLSGMARPVDGAESTMQVETIQGQINL
jgi:hypothetical protein